MKKLLIFLLILSLCALCLLPVGASTYEDGTPSGVTESTLTADEILLRILVCFLIALVVSLVAVLLMKRALSTVRKEKSADRYTEEGSFALTESRDIFLYSTVTRVRVNNSNNRNRR